MKRDQFISLLVKPEIIDSTTSGQLHDVLISFPYCQSARLLYVKSLTDQHSILYNDQLKIAAAYASDRNQLFELMNQTRPQTNSENIGKIIEDEHIISGEQNNLVELISEAESTKDVNQISEINIVGAIDVESLNESVVVNENEKGNAEKEFDVKERSNEIDEKVEDVNENKINEITSEQIISKDEIDFSEKPKESELSPREIIRQRLAELNLTEKKTEIETSKENISELSSFDKNAETGENESNSKTEFEDKILVENELKENITDEIIIQQPEIIVSTLIEEEHIELDELDESSVSIESQKISSLENEFEESSFAQDVKFNYNSSRDSIESSPVSFETAENKINNAVTETAESTLRIKGEHSFISWLKAIDTDSVVVLNSIELVKLNENKKVDLAKPNLQNVADEIESAKDAESSSELINRFIEQDPKIEPGKAEFYSAGNMAKNSIIDDGSVASETLANVYLEQGNYQKAINMLELLSLKNSKKRTYFANRIKEIKNNNR